MRGFNKAREKTMKQIDGRKRTKMKFMRNWLVLNKKKIPKIRFCLSTYALVRLVVGIMVYSAIEYIFTILQCYKKARGTELMSTMESAALTQTRLKLTEIRN